MRVGVSGMSEELVDPHFTVDGLPCKSKGDMVTCGIGLPARNPKVQFIVKMRVNEHREQAVRRKKEELARALSFMAAATGSLTRALISVLRSSSSRLKLHTRIEALPKVLKR